MAITLPHWLVEVVDFLGFNWPEIDEDQLHEAATHLRSFADGAEQSMKSTHQLIHGDIAEVYQAQSYGALVQSWSGQTKGHMETLIEVSRLFADALDVAADGVVAMKGEVIVQLGIAAGEFVADQAAAVATLGLAEAALPVLLEVQNKLLGMIIKRFEDEVVSVLVDNTIGPLRDRVDAAVAKLLFDGVADLVVGPPPPGVKVDTDALAAHAATIKGEAIANQNAGRDLNGKLGSLHYTTGG